VAVRVLVDGLTGSVGRFREFHRTEEPLHRHDVAACPELQRGERMAIAGPFAVAKRHVVCVVLAFKLYRELLDFGSFGLFGVASRFFDLTDHA
jgi:hypothetical protein